MLSSLVEPGLKHRIWGNVPGEPEENSEQLFSCGYHVQPVRAAATNAAPFDDRLIERVQSEPKAPTHRADPASGG